MTLMPLKIHPLGFCFCGFSLVGMLCGFGSVHPPQTDMDDATRSLEAARNAGAATYAPLELRFASERMEQAQLALAAKDKAAVQRITEEVIVTAELAVAKVHLAKVREQMEQKTKENAKLRNDFLSGREGQKP